MPGSLGRAAVRLLGWWRWYRLALFGAFALGFVVAVSLDNTVGSVVVGLASLVPLAVLISLSGARVADHHQRIDALRKNASGAREVDALRQDLPTIAAGAAQGSAVMIVVIVQPRDARAIDLVARLSQQLPATTIHALDRSGDPEITGAIGSLLGEGSALSLASSSNARSVVDDVAELVGASRARHVLVLDRSIRAGHADDVVRLVAAAPGPDEPWVGATVLGHRNDMFLLRRAAFNELGGFGDAFSLHEDLEDALVGAGYVVDRVERTATVGELAVTDGELVELRRGGRHALAGGIAFLPHRGGDVDDLAAAARDLAVRGVAAGLVMGESGWERHRSAAFRWPLASYRLEAAGAWLADLGAIVTTNDWSQEMREVVETARRYGVPTIGRLVGIHDFEDRRTGRDRSAFQSVDIVLCQGAADAAVVAGFGGTPVVVGNTRLETLWRRPAAQADPPSVVVHANFPAAQADDEALYLRTALAACHRLDIPVVVTGEVHSGEVAVEGGPLGESLARASVVVARFGAAPLEAIARGIPFVHHDPHDEQMPLFSDSRGAFETSRSEGELAELVTEALSWRAQARDRSEAFFRHHVDITDTPSVTRMADAIAAAVLDRA